MRMKISAQEEYGLRCLLRLARVEPDQPPLTIPEIAADEKLSPAHVAKMLSVLRQGGLIDSVRGRTGGYRIARPPEDIHLGAVLLALGEPLFDEGSFCERHTGPEPGECVHHHGCTLRALWQTLEGWMRRSLDQLTLDDLLHGHAHVAQAMRERLRDDGPPAVELIPLTTLSR
jgi:Rrf2 family protein